MKQIQTIEDVYSALDEMAGELQAAGQSRLAAILHHRLHQVAWTTRSELLEELHKLLTNALDSNQEELPLLLRQQIERILLVIGNFLNTAKE